MSSQIIAFTKRIEFKTLLDIECKSMTGFAPVVKDSLDDFQSLLGLLTNIDVLIIDEPPMPKDFKLILDMVSEKQSSIKNILILGNEAAPLKNSRIFPQDKIQLLVDHLKTLLGSESSQSVGYISVPSDSLIHFKILPFDLYIKISEEKYLKRIPANEDIDEATVMSFRTKGITDLYFEKKYNRDFSLMLLNNMINKVEKNYSTVDEKIKARNEVFLTTKEIVQSVGLPPRVVQVCESVMESISEDVIKGKDKFSSYLLRMKDQSNLNFQFRFVELTSFIATQMVDGMNEADKVEQIKKVVFAAFFCDISLTEVGQLDYRTEDSIKDLWPEDKKAVNEHALKASEIVTKYKNAPADADIIVKQHHGSADGVGFPPVSDLILPLAKCLMAAQELAYSILKQPGKSPESIVNQAVNRFQGSPIHSYLEAFEKSCKANL